MTYEGPSLRMSNRQYTLALKLARNAISGQAILFYDQRTVISMLKTGLLTGSLKEGFALTLEGHARLNAFGHSHIERTSTKLAIPEFVLNFRGGRKILRMHAA